MSDADRDGAPREESPHDEFFPGESRSDAAPRVSPYGRQLDPVPWPTLPDDGPAEVPAEIPADMSARGDSAATETPTASGPPLANPAAHGTPPANSPGDGAAPAYVTPPGVYQAPYPAPQHPFAVDPRQPVVRRPTAGLATTGMVLGIVAVLFSFGGVGVVFIFVVLAVVFSALGLNESRKHQPPVGRARAIAGLSLGALSLVLIVFAIVT